MNEIITSTQNPKVKHLLLLQQKSAERKKEGVFIVEGCQEITHCINNRLPIITVVLCGIKTILPCSLRHHNV